MAASFGKNGAIIDIIDTDVNSAAPSNTRIIFCLEVNGIAVLEAIIIEMSKKT